MSRFCNGLVGTGKSLVESSIMKCLLPPFELVHLIIIVMLSVTLLFFSSSTEQSSNYRVTLSDTIELPWISNADGHTYPYTATVIALACMLGCIYGIIVCAAGIHM